MSARALVAAILCLLAVSSCTSTVTGSGGTAASPSGSGSDLPSASAAPAGSFPRTPLSTSIGDPATANLCAAIPLSTFAGLGYTPEYSTVSTPPTCSVRLNTGTETRIIVYVYGVGPNNFSHQDTTGTSSQPRRTGTISGFKVRFYSFDRGVGNCQRDVLADGITLRVAVISRAPTGRADRTADCAGADAMTHAAARAAASGTVPRLKLATASLSAIDFCAALRATKLSDISQYADGQISHDGVGDGCQLTLGTNFYFFIDFAVGNARQPDATKPITVGGHLLYASDSNDSSNCNLTFTHATTSEGRFEQVLISASVYSANNKGDLCGDATTVAARFLDRAGLK